ncbi:MAG: hypothetical protein V8S24_02725 [Gordonibacter pamelaeae]
MTPSLRKELWRTPDLLGFAAHWTWIWCVFWSSLFYAEGTLLNSSGSAGAAAGLSTIALEPLWVTSLLANVVTIAFLLLLSYLRNPLSDVRCLPALAAALTALGTLAISHPSLVMTGGGAWASTWPARCSPAWAAASSWCCGPSFWPRWGRSAR